MRPGINALGHKVRRCSDKRIAKSEPPAAAAMKPFSKSPLLQGRGPGPGAHSGAPPFPPGPLQAAGPDPLWCAALRAACGPPSFWPLRVPSCAGAPAPARVPSGPGRLPPLRGPGPAFCALASLAGAGPRAFPPALSLGPCAPLRGSVASRWPRCAWVALRPLRASAASLWSPLLCSVLPLALRGFPAGSPLARPLSRLRARRLPAPGPARASPARCGLSAPGLFAARRACAACFLRRGFPSGLGASPSALLGLCGASLALLRSRRIGLFPLRPGALPRCLSGASPLPPSRPCRPLRGLAGSGRLRLGGSHPRAFGAPPLVAAASFGLDIRSILWYHWLWKAAPPLFGAAPLGVSMV